MWELYDQLIEGIPADISVKDVRVGNTWGYASTDSSCGIGVLYHLETRLPLYNKNWVGAPLKELAECIKSWNFLEASIGAAAINCFYNSQEMAKKNNIDLSSSSFAEDRLHDPFISYQRMIKGKNVAVVGHFPYLETLFEPVCNLSIIETTPKTGDFPYYSAEYILPEQDFVFITCGCVVNKTLPRILELSRKSYNVLVGPATPMAPVLFEHGINDLSGFIFQDLEKADRILTGGQFGTLYATGHKVNLCKDTI